MRILWVAEHDRPVDRAIAGLRKAGLTAACHACTIADKAMRAGMPHGVDMGNPGRIVK